MWIKYFFRINLRPLGARLTVVTNTGVKISDLVCNLHLSIGSSVDTVFVNGANILSDCLAILMFLFIANRNCEAVPLYAFISTNFESPLK